MNGFSNRVVTALMASAGLVGVVLPGAGHAQPAYWFPSLPLVDPVLDSVSYATASWNGALYTWRQLLPGVGFGLYRWTGSAWQRVIDLSVPELDGFPHVMIVHGGDMYVGGEFQYARVPGTTPWTTQVNGLVRLHSTGAAWEGLPAVAGSSVEFGVQDPCKVYTLLSQGDTLYIGGEFEQIGNLVVPAVRHAGHVAKFVTSATSPFLEAVGGGFDSTQVRDLAWLNGWLYAAGPIAFFEPPVRCTPAPCARVARYNSSANCWEAVQGVWTDASDPEAFGQANTLAVHNGALYIGGSFTHVGPSVGARVAAKNIAVLTGDTGSSPTWNALPAGGLTIPFDFSEVVDLLSANVGCGQELFAAGDFVRNEGSPPTTMTNVATLRAGGWSPLTTVCPGGPTIQGQGGASPFQTFVEHGGHLYSRARRLTSEMITRWGACRGDANGDGTVDFLDLNIVLGEYEFTMPVQGDLNCDGTVDFLDLNIVLSYFGAVCDSVCNHVD